MSLINNLLNRLDYNHDLYIGYPPATDFTLSSLGELLNYSLNNLGDPMPGNSPVGSHEFEKEVVDFFMKLYHTDSHQSWGYVASCSTEAVLYGCWRAREYIRRYNKEIVIIASDYAHFCIGKVANILDLKIIYVESNKDGSINNEKLTETLQKNKEKSMIFFATLGSTITSSLDDFYEFKNTAKELGIHYYVHADAALDGGFLPFVKDYTMCDDFDSINISGHKFIGSPIPSGILIINKEYIKRTDVKYVPIQDVTIGGSRDGVTSVLLYEQIKNIGGETGLKKRYHDCLKKAEEFKAIALSQGVNVWKIDHAITLVFDKVDDIFLEKWLVPSYQEYTTLTALPRLTEEKFNAFLHDVLYFKNHGKRPDNTKMLLPSPLEPL